MHIVVVRNNSNQQAVDAAFILLSYLQSQGITSTLVDSHALVDPCVKTLSAASSPVADMVVTLGGDGTILRTARLVGDSAIPILGINFGRLGFLANDSADGIVAIVASALAGDAVQEQRANLRIDVICEGEKDPWQDIEGQSDFPACESVANQGDDAAVAGCLPAQDLPHTFFALNELAITRGASGRIIDFSLCISGEHLADMRGDGLVVATATGSTGYALSAGGPLVAPGFSGLVVVPIAPHTLHSRALVTSASDVVEIGLGKNASNRESVLFADGDPLVFDAPIAHVYVRIGEVPTVLLRYKRKDFYRHVSDVFF